MDTTWEAILLRPILGPVMMFALFGTAWLVGVAVWKWMPAGKLKAKLLERQSPGTAILWLLFAVLVIPGIVVTCTELIPQYLAQQR